MRADITNLVTRLQQLGPTIAELCQITGMAGLSLGVMHHGQVIHTANFGYRDITARIAPNENTTFVIGSLTKAITAAMAGILVEQRKLEWTTMLRDVIPEFQREHDDPAANITMEDLLSHRTGLPGLDGLWLLSGGAVALNHADVIAVLGSAPVAKALRSEFLYNNFGYEVVGQVIAKRSGIPYEAFLEQHILRPLGMDRTYYTTPRLDAENAAKAYACFLNLTQVEIPQPLEGKDIAIGAAGGVRSSVRDLLALDRAFLDAFSTHFGEGGYSASDVYANGNPVKQVPELWSSMIRLPSTSFREHSYALGWTRAQLPQDLGVPGTDYVTVGKGAACAASRTLLYHEGSIPGFFSFNALLPEESSAVVVLGNSHSLAEPTKLIGALLIETLIHSTVNTTAFIEAATVSAGRGRNRVSKLFKWLQHRRNVVRPTRPLASYDGRYFHPVAGFYIDVKAEAEKLIVSFMGKREDTYELEPYQPDSFFWQMSHDDYVSKGRYTFSPDYYVLRFGCEDEGRKKMKCLKWKYDDHLQGDGEVFRAKHNPHPPREVQHQSFVGSFLGCYRSLGGRVGLATQYFLSH